MICPACREDRLETRTLKESPVKVEHCGKCGGLWFDGGELARAVPTAVHGLRTPEDAEATGLRCPRCTVPLQRFVYPQTYVKVDRCSDCKGLWLNRDEFREVQVVRNHLEEKGELEPDPIPGVKGSLISFIDSAIEALCDMDE